MRIMLDTNILISAFVFRSSQMSTVIIKITEKYKLVISSFVIDELTEVVKRKFPNHGLRLGQRSYWEKTVIQAEPEYSIAAFTWTVAETTQAK